VLAHHQAFEDILSEMELGKKIGRSRIAEVLSRLMAAAMAVPKLRPSQREIAHGDMFAAYREPLPADAVSRTVTALTSMEMITSYEPRADRPGRPYVPLELRSEEWALIGIKVGHSAGRIVSFDVIALELNGEPIHTDLYNASVSDGKAWWSIQYNDGDGPFDPEKVIATLADKIEELYEQPPLRHRFILGVGIELAGHVFEGDVVDASLNKMTGVNLGEQLSGHLKNLSRKIERLPNETRARSRRIPVIIDNDLNVLAAYETYNPRFPESDIAVVAVFDDGIGAGLIQDGRVYRGGQGMAGELTHSAVAVELPQPEYEETQTSNEVGESVYERSSSLPKFDDPCHCGRSRHLDCYSTPVRICGQLGYDSVSDFSVLASMGSDGSPLPSEVAETFKIAGQALGITLASMINMINPSRILLYLPPVLAGDEDGPPKGSAAAIYRRSITRMIDLHSFSKGRKTRLTVEPLGMEYRRFFGATSAGLRVLDSFIKHARRECTCYKIRTWAIEDEES
jgi:predicted NBD/HSP70 family sugar kinase